MTGRTKFRLQKKQLLWAVPILAAVLAALCISFGPSSRSAMRQHLRERYNREFVILSTEKVPCDLLGHRIYSARTFTAAPASSPPVTGPPTAFGPSSIIITTTPMRRSRCCGSGRRRPGPRERTTV